VTGPLTLRGSSERTFESLYRGHVAEIYRYVRLVLDSPADAEDVTQATFLNAYRAIERGERPDQPRNWLMVIAHNLCRQHFRQAARRPREVELTDSELRDLVADDERIEFDDLVRALRLLPVNQRAALVMREFEGRSLADIARVLETTGSATETLLFRARRSLREQLEGGLSCLEAEQAISRQLDGRLPRAERGALRAHLRECRDCAQHARRLRAQRRAMQSLLGVPIPASLAWSRFAPQVGLGAGSTAAAAGTPFAASIAAKVAIAAIATTATAGVTYEGVAQHVFSSAHHGGPAAARGHAATARGTASVGTRSHVAPGVVGTQVAPFERGGGAATSAPPPGTPGSAPATSLSSPVGGPTGPAVGPGSGHHPAQTGPAKPAPGGANQSGSAQPAHGQPSRPAHHPKPPAAVPPHKTGGSTDSFPFTTPTTSTTTTTTGATTTTPATPPSPPHGKPPLKPHTTTPFQ
jgi:RNA polymerase sigma factor (sigma-70 family)